MAIFNNPYPILSNSKGNFNDIGAEFNCTISNVEFSENNYKIELKAEIINEPVLQGMLLRGEIVFVVTVDCKPFYRKVFKSNSSPDEVTIEIDYREISSEFAFELTPKLITEIELTYKNENADTPICDYEFNLSPSQKLAEHDKIEFVFDRAYKLFDAGPLIEIRKLPKGHRVQNGTMDINLDHQYNIIVSVSSENYDIIKETNKVNQKLLSTSLSMIVIYHALYAIKDHPEDFSGIDWAEALDQRYGVFDKLQSAVDVLKITDEILKSPLIDLYNYTINKSD
jgi:hypothetical protein